MSRSGRAAMIATAACAAAVATAPAASASASGAAACRPAEARVVAGRTVTLALDCRVFAGGRVVYRVKGATGRSKTTISTRRARLGTLGTVVARTGRVAFAARTAGTETITYTLVARGGKRYRGALLVRVSPAPRGAPVGGAGTTTAPAAAATTTTSETTTPTPASPAPATPTTPTVPPDGLPEVLPAVKASVASSTRAWAPTVYDTCAKEIHERFSVIGPDGLRYPTWHPATYTDPATGRTCTFGHEHGDDPKTSDIYGWVSQHLAAAGYERFAGVGFGLAAEALNTWAAGRPGTPTRAEDHPGYKVDVVDDVALLGADGAANGVTCDYLTVVHQGSHSADALSNSAHELLYATRCSDGTEVISTTLSRFGHPGSYQRSCDPATSVTTTDNGYPDGGGARLIPDRTCVEREVLVPAGRTTSAWALYEKWTSVNTLRAADDTPIASFDTSFGVFNPARYASSTLTAARTLALCWETASDGDRADGVDCKRATGDGALTTAYNYDDPRSPFNGTRRDVYLAGTAVRNRGGARVIWTDPYGGNASATAFPGALCQLVSTTDNGATSNVRVQVFNRNKDNNATGVHAPN